MRAPQLLAGSFLSVAIAAMAAQARSHCAADEEVLFSCRAGAKVLSFCASKSSEVTPPTWIQYRFGRLGKAELVYPAKKVSPVGHFQYSSEHGGRWVNVYVQFSIDGFSYVLSAYGNSNIPESDASLLIVSPGGARRVMQCADPGLYAAAGLAPFQQFHLPEVQAGFRK